MAKQLPPEMVAEILCRLPVKSLLRFRCLSKPFCSLIDSPNFTKHHLDHSLKNNTNLSLLVTDCSMSETIVSFDYDSLGNQVCLKNPLKEAPGDAVKRMGFCNGLLCLCRFNGDVALLNAATRKHHILPHLGQKLLKLKGGLCTGAVFCYGFGYDPSCDDYKVVRIGQFTDIYAQCFFCEVMVYSLKENAWKKVREDFPYSLSCGHNLAPFVSGNVHLQVVPISELVPVVEMGTKQANIIVGFDLSVEKYNEVPLPDSVVGSNIHLNLAVLGGCLCVVPICSDVIRGDIWVMKEYGVKESWTVLFSLAPEGRLSKYPEVLPVAYSMKGDKVLLEVAIANSQRKRLFWYDLREKKMSIVKKLRKKLSILFVADVMVDSLVSLEVVQGEQQEDLKEKKKKSRETRDDCLSTRFKMVV